MIIFKCIYIPINNVYLSVINQMNYKTNNDDRLLNLFKYTSPESYTFDVLFKSNDLLTTNERRILFNLYNNI